MCKKIPFILVVIIVLFLGNAHAANHYVRAGADGVNDGSDWTNAWQKLPETLVRGDVYLIADGSYPNYTFDDGVSGSLTITIKKATVADHGTSTGWSNNYGDGQAQFDSPLNFRSSNWLVDGNTGSGEKPESYGFYVEPTSCSVDSRLMGIPAVGDASYEVNNITVKHTAFVLCGESADPNIQIGIYSNPNNYNAYNILIANNYFSGASSNMAIRYWKDSIIENNYFAGNWSSTSNHGQQISPGNECDDIILRGNTFVNSTIFVLGTHKANNKRWKIYNNIVIDGGNSMNAVWANADSGTSDVMINWEIHHNTHIGGLYSRGIVFVGNLTDTTSYRSVAYNNLSYNATNPRLDNATFGENGIIHSHNSYYVCSGEISSEDNISIKTNNPFVDISKNNFRLIEPTANGKILSSPFDQDIINIYRGSDSNNIWDRGAFEFYAPINLKVVQ